MELSLNSIRWECENNSELYGKKICDRTWQKWQRIVFTDKVKGQKYPQAMVVDKQTAVYFFALARYRRLHPKNQIKWKQLTEYAKRLGDKNLGRGSHYAITGRDLPAIIQSLCKVSLSEKTLYRWSKKHDLTYSRHLAIGEKEISAWVDVVKRERNLYSQNSREKETVLN